MLLVVGVGEVVCLKSVVVVECGGGCIFVFATHRLLNLLWL